MPETDAGAGILDIDENHAAILEGATKLGAGCTVDLVAMAFEIPDRAARHFGGLCELALGPVDQPARGPA